MSQPLSEESLRERIRNIWHTHSIEQGVNAIENLILEERARELSMLLRAGYIDPEHMNTVTIAKEALDRQRNCKRGE